MACRGLIAAMSLAAAVGVARAQEAPAPPPVQNTLEIGGGGVTDGSYKAGEFNGLQKKGAFAVANIDLRDRTPYGSTSALRWRVRSRDLGLDTRSAMAQVGQQGKFRLTAAFDQLRRNRSDSYQSPYAGTGTTTLTLPDGWLLPTIASPAGNTTSARGLVPAIGGAAFLSNSASNQGAVVTPSAAQLALVNAAAAADVPAFRNVNLSTKRTTYDVGFAYLLNERWGVNADVRPEHKDGLKPMGTVSRNTGGDISVVIPDVIDNDHNQVNTGLSYSGAHGAAQIGYYGSFFRNNVASMSWENWAAATHTLNTMSSAPSNDFNQVTASGVARLGAAMRLIADGSYGRATQNDLFLTDATTPVVPVNSLNGLVVTRMFGAKLTGRPSHKLNLLASYRYNDRDNQTPVNIFQYADVGEDASKSANFPAGSANPLGAVLAQNANANRPYGRTTNQATLDADFAIAPRQWVKAGYDFERIDRACAGSWISCEDAARTNENTLRVDWRTNAGSQVTARFGYARSWRRTPVYNENAFLALVPYANVSPASATAGATALSFMTGSGWDGWGPALGYAATTGNMNVFFPSNNALANAQYANGNRISELAGLRRYWVADRDRDKVRSSLMWQANETFSFQGGFDLNRDDYTDATYGLQNWKGWAANADVGYSPSDTLTADVFYTFERQRGLTAGETYTANSNAATIANAQPGAVGLSGNECDGYATLQQRNNNNKIDPCLPWSSDNRDDVHTAGLTIRKKTPHADVTADVVLARARSNNDVTGGNWANNVVNGLGGPPTTIAAFFIPATPFPTVTTNSAEVRLNGLVPVAKAQTLRLAYAYLRMRSSDWVYEGMQLGAGTLSGVLPSNEQPFNYSVSVLSLSYVFGF